MPELPEVESIRRKLEPFVIRRTILDVTVLRRSMVKDITPLAFRKNLLQKQIQSLSRKGKHLIFHLAPNGYLLIHLGMTGRLLLSSSQPPHARIRFSLDHGTDLWFTDSRTFGKVGYYDQIPKNILTLIDAIENDYTEKWLRQEFKKRDVPIKVALLDQKIVAGIGNIYANEILFYSGVSPFLSTRQLTKTQVKRIYEGIHVILSNAVAAEGTTFSDFLNVNGVPGNFQFQLAVYLRNNQPCLRCGTPIVKENFRQRGTYYCPTCQK